MNSVESALLSAKPLAVNFAFTKTLNPSSIPAGAYVDDLAPSISSGPLYH